MNLKASPTIKVFGTGEFFIQPDTALVSLGAVTEGKELSIIQKENATIINAVIDALIQQGIRKEFIQTEDYRIEPVHEFREEKQILFGYRVKHLLQVRVNNVNTVGDMIDSAVQKGSNVIQGIYFTVDNSDFLYNQALQKAVRDTQHKAITIATTIGVRLNPVPILIEEETTRVFPQGRLITFAAEATPIQPGQQKIEARIKAEYTYY
jgi:uncharacterized protein YggE